MGGFRGVCMEDQSLGGYGRWMMKWAGRAKLEKAPFLCFALSLSLSLKRKMNLTHRDNNTEHLIMNFAKSLRACLANTFFFLFLKYLFELFC
jgi:hypothetical protein